MVRAKMRVELNCRTIKWKVQLRRPFRSSFDNRPRGLVGTPAPWTSQKNRVGATNFPSGSWANCLLLLDSNNGMPQMSIIDVMGEARLPSLVLYDVKKRIRGLPAVASCIQS